MASANEPADLKVVIEDPFGNQQICHKFRSDSAVNAGKSPDGVLANLTHDKQLKVPTAPPIASAGYKVRLFASLDAADGIDASDCVIQIPVTYADGTEKVLSASDIGFTTDLPAATPATYWVECGTGYTVPDGVRLRVGSASMLTPIVISLEDDT
jgi:hypothetical protein